MDGRVERRELDVELQVGGAQKPGFPHVFQSLFELAKQPLTILLLLVE